MAEAGYNLRPPGAAVLCAGLREVSVEREAWYYRRGQLIGGRIQAGNTLYKLPRSRSMRLAIEDRRG